MPIKTLLNNLIIPAVIVSAAIFISYTIVVLAQTPEISYPIIELGNCNNQTECKNFCDKPANMIPCVNFAEKNGLMSEEEATKAKAFAQAGMKGPGGCAGKEECEAFCDDSANMEACINFAKENGMMDKEEIQEAEKILKVIKEGSQLPGGCKNKKDCESYCDNPEHMEECLAFAEKAGFISGGELEEAKKAAKAMASGIKPPGNCRGKKECDSYCSNPDNMEECLAFAEAAGFIPKEEVEMAKKMMPLMKAGKMPGGCKGKDECEAYCGNESNMEECANFAMEAGLMKPEEVETFKKTGGKGPGDCKGKEQCEAFCNDQANQEICFNFAKEHNLIPEGMKMMRGEFEMAPPKGVMPQREKMELPEGMDTPSKEIIEELMKQRERMPEGFEGFMPTQDNRGMMPSGIPEEYRKYIEMAPSNIMPPEGMNIPENIPEQ